MSSKRFDRLAAILAAVLLTVAPFALAASLGSPIPSRWTWRLLLSCRGLIDVVTIVAWAAWLACLAPMCLRVVSRVRHCDVDCRGDERFMDWLSAQIAACVLALIPIPATFSLHHLLHRHSTNSPIETMVIQGRSSQFHPKTGTTLSWNLQLDDSTSWSRAQSLIEHRAIGQRIVRTDTDSEFEVGSRGKAVDRRVNLTVREALVEQALDHDRELPNTDVKSIDLADLLSDLASVGICVLGGAAAVRRFQRRSASGQTTLDSPASPEDDWAGDLATASANITKLLWSLETSESAGRRPQAHLLRVGQSELEVTFARPIERSSPGAVTRESVTPLWFSVTYSQTFLDSFQTTRFRW